MDHIGIDVHKKESQICILTEVGELIERRVRTELRRFAEELGARPRARILLEASTDLGPMGPKELRSAAIVRPAHIPPRP